MAALPGLELTCFGPPTASVDGGPAPPEVLWTKHLALLVYLALSPGRRRSREHLMGLFWGESTQDRARGALNETLRRLRTFLGDQRVLSEGTAVVLHDEGLAVDALRVMTLADRAPHEAVVLLRGEFLEGFNVKRAQELEEWMSAERRRFSTLRVGVLIKSGEQRLSEGRAGAAADLAQQALQSAPHSEAAIALLMRALDVAGDSSASLAAHREFTERLEREVRERPSKALVALAERIRSGSSRHGPTPNTPRVAPLAGRSTVHRDAFETVVAGGPHTIVIAGPSGMGRSRLLAECVARSVLAGARTARARQFESDHDARWSLLRQLCRAGLAEAPGLAGARPEALAVLAALVPELSQRFPAHEVHDVAQVGAALAAVLTAVADESPWCLAVDDAHWADGASIAALHAAMASLERAAVTLVVTVATDVGDVPRELQQLQAAVGLGLPGVAVRLDPLAHEDVRSLVTALAPWCDDDDKRDRLARWLAIETGGSPLLVVTLLAAFEKDTRFRENSSFPRPNETDVTRLPFSVPKLAYMGVKLRIGELDKDEQAVLSAAAIGGLGLDLGLIAVLSERSESDVERALPGLERRHLVKYDGTRYAFVAALVVEVVRAECLTAGQRRRMESQAIAALAGRADLESQALRCELLARIESSPAALSFVVATLRAAQDAGAVRLARRVRAAGDEMASRGGLDRRELDQLASLA